MKSQRKLNHNPFNSGLSNRRRHVVEPVIDKNQLSTSRPAPKGRCDNRRIRASILELLKRRGFPKHSRGNFPPTGPPRFERTIAGRQGDRPIHDGTLRPPAFGELTEGFLPEPAHSAHLQSFNLGQAAWPRQMLLHNSFDAVHLF